MGQPILMRSFVAGELAPAFHSRADMQQFRAGLALCRNCFVKAEGGVMNRAGTYMAAEVKDSAVQPRILPFVFEGADQTYLLEFGEEYVRFYWHGEQVESGGNPYEVATPYAAADVLDLHFAQSADVIVITHPDYPPAELRRNDHTDWSYDVISFAPSISAPENLGGSVGVAGTRTVRYVATALKSDTYEESLASEVLELTNAEDPTIDAPNELTCDAGDGAAEYLWYKDPYGNGIFGLVGTSAAPAFNDVGFAPDFSITPPVARTLFDAVDTYPALCSFYQQRLMFARSNNEPETVWGSRIGSFHNFSISTPLKDDDAVTFVLASETLNPVHHLVALKRLLVLTDMREWIIRGDEQGVLRPIAINGDEEGYNGAHPRVRPVRVGNRLLYVQARGTVLREMGFDVQPQGLGGRDLTVFASHLFDGHAIRRIAYQQQPHSIIWAVRDDGVLLSCTYMREQDVVAWARHDTGADGEVEDVVVLPDTSIGEDVVYLVVKRTIGGSTVRFVERMASRFVTQDTLAEDAFFVDCGLTYDGAPIQTLTGLDHLEGETVSVLGDGADLGSFTVTGGEVDLPVTVSVAHVGLPITAEIETLSLDVEGTSVRDRRKIVTAVTAHVVDTPRTFAAGPDEDNLAEAGREPWETAAGLVTGPIEVPVTSLWDEHGRVHLAHTAPMPFHLTGLVPNVGVGG